MKLAALVLLVAVGIAFTSLGSEALSPHQVIQALMGGAPPYWKVCFALDSSGSISDSEWSCSKSSTRNILAIINSTPAPNSVSIFKHKIGLVRFSSTTPTQVIFSMGTHPFFPANDAAIAAVEKVGYWTNLYKALVLCDGELGSLGKRLVWIMTDGQYNKGGDPRPTAAVMKKKGIIICVVVIGDNVNWTVINAIASWIWVKTSSGYFIYVRCVLIYQTCKAYFLASYPLLTVVP
ncbi:uncharacterized protein LOC106155929 [Lingula anatina]|uniref:Uncharacterized protein LOC106155929 n=1 Tax=Lingula anatina TaxID=7574 RepID=A0A1S3HJX9_LINAN|nr:uncharacterized protein LOC106155929 [Lingula anatina]|eukprot:XP_013386425.1 uncharacterized protein LOC106155929 [Lingula anatina]